MPNKTMNLWYATAGERAVSPPLRGRAAADVVVIGAGIMGAAAALRFAEGGAKVALLDAADVGSGATSAAGGFVVPHFSVGTPREIGDRVGEVGPRLVEAVGRSADHVFARIRELGIECEARQDGWFHPAHSEAAWRRILTLAEQWSAAGFPGELLSGREAEERTGVRGWHGAWLAPSGGTIHPLLYCRGLAEAAVERGAILYEHSPVRAIERESGRYRLATDGGTIVAEKVVICTNGLSSDLVPPLERTIVPLRVWQCATAPLSAEERAGLFQGGECLSDTRRNLFTYRFDAGGRLVTGAFDAFGVSTGGAAASMALRLQRMLGLRNRPTVTHIWSGTSSISAARLPASLVVDGDLIAASACNARGIALSTIVGEAIAELAVHGTAPPVPLLDASAPSTARLQARLGRFYAHLAPVIDWIDARRSRA